jgi:hypothetical protein
MPNSPSDYGINLSIIQSQTIAAMGSTSATTFGDLTAGDTTVGPVVTAYTGTSVILSLMANGYNDDGSPISSGYVSVDITGATTQPADDRCQATVAKRGNAALNANTRMFVLTGLTPGLNTFTLKYRSDIAGRVWKFQNRTLAVIPI